MISLTAGLKLLSILRILYCNIAQKANKNFVIKSSVRNVTGSHRVTIIRYFIGPHLKL